MSNMFNSIFRKKKTSSLPNSETKSKYGNKKVEYDGIKFDSKKECEYYKGLKLLEQKKEISDIKTQVKFKLLDPFTDFGGEKHRGISYFADFQYTDKDGNNIVVDVKASIKFLDPVYKIKKKLLLSIYKDMIFKEIF